jgi:ADP-heptose:LPS heptosyltransferase
MLQIAGGAGFPPPSGDDGTLAVRRPLPSAAAKLAPLAGADYLVVHPGTSAPARAYPPPLWRAAVSALRADGWAVVVTGSASERQLTAEVSAAAALDLGGRLSLAELAAVLDGAAVVVVANTGPAHLAAAVGTPVVSLFSPVVPAVRWAPHGVPLVLLGDQDAPCRDSRSRLCPVAGHPCLSSVRSTDILAAVRRLTPSRMDTLAGAR